MKRKLEEADLSCPMSSPALVTFKHHHEDFATIIGDNPTFTLLAEDTLGSPLFHEACIYHADSNSVFVTSNQIPHSSLFGGSDDRGVTRLFRIHDTGHPAKVEDVTPPELERSMLNGGVNYDSQSILLCAQGSHDPNHMNGIVRVPIPPTHSKSSAPSQPPTTLISSFHSRPFNSLNDVIVHPTDHSIWFTDPCYGYHQGFRPPPSLPNQVYRYDPANNSIRAVADGFTRPNGLCFSPDLQTLYVTDTGALSGQPNEPANPAGQNHIYAFTINSTASGQPFLTNRRLSAYADGGCPDGIKCDTDGNVYCGCGDGIEVWNTDGVLLGRICVEGGVANFCFGAKGCLYVCNESRFWKVQLKEGVRGALLGM